MREKIDDINKLGAELVVVGSGRVEFATAFQKKLNINTPFFVDPSLESFKAAGLKRSKLGTLGPLNFLPALKALFKGNVQGRVQGDAFQQGGAFIILPGNKLVYSYISKRSSDRPPIKKILKKLEEEKQKTAN